MDEEERKRMESVVLTEWHEIMPEPRFVVGEKSSEGNDDSEKIVVDLGLTKCDEIVFMRFRKK